MFCQDFTVFGGALGEVFAEKIHKLMDLALKVGAPVIGLNDGAGARIQEGVVCLASYGGIFYRNVKASGVTPQISVIMGPCAGGAVYSPAMTDFIFMVDETSYMFITGPDVVKTVTGEEVTQQELGGARTHASKSGVAQFISADDKACLDDVRYLLAFLPSNNLEEPPRFEPTDDPDDRRCPELYDIIPASANQPYDMRNVIEVGRRRRRLLRVRPALGRVASSAASPASTATAWASSATSRHVLAGVLDIESSAKAARFVRTCDAFNIPLVTFVDVPGFLPGVDQEHGGIIRHGAKLLYAYCEATVPRISVITRKAYGGAYVVMDSKSIGADLAFAWPSAELAVMGAQGAVEIVNRRELGRRRGPGGPPGRAGRGVRARTSLNPCEAADRGYVDDVIDPAETRIKLIAGLEMLALQARGAPQPQAREHAALMSGVGITPEPTDEEAAAIVAALELGVPRAAAVPPVDEASRWRWSGRWWSKPIPSRRGRPGD